MRISIHRDINSQNLHSIFALLMLSAFQSKVSPISCVDYMLENL
jgi:hypothetical protein